MSRTLQKQISIFLPLLEWKAMRAEAAKQQIPITELCRRWLTPQMERLKEKETGRGSIEQHERQDV